MLVSEARSFVGGYVVLSYRDKSGHVHEEIVEVYDVGFVAHFGPCLITDCGEFRLDRVVECREYRALRAA